VNESTPPPEAVGASAPPRRGILLATAILFLLAALATRFWALGERPLHHDESIHAYQSYTLSKAGDWRYDPAYHGPFLYYANALVYKVLGDTNFTARLLPAIFGLILIAAAWPLSRWIGKGAAATYALFILLSPHFTYFSRFIREDLYSAVFTLATILCFQMALETDRAGWLYGSATFFALAGITKETAYMTGVLFVAFGLWSLLERAFLERPRLPALARAISATARWVSRRILPILGAGLLFLTIWALGYTSFGKYPSDWLAIPKAVRYWMGQHAIARISGPWWYYFPQLAYYATAVVLAAFFAFRRQEERRSAFLRFVLFWALASLAIYSWAREKVPWLTVHPLLPITILAAVGAASLWRDRARTLPRIALTAIGLLLVVNTTGMYLANFRYAAHDKERVPNHAETLAYVQTTWDLVRALEAVELAKNRAGAGPPLVTVAGEATWPLTWYLRNTQTSWVGRIEQASTPVIVADWDPEGSLEKQLAERYEARRVPIRAWWFPEAVHASAESKTARPTFSDLVSWYFFHRIWSPIGSQDATFFVRKDLSAAGPLEPIELKVQDLSAREYPSPGDLLPADRVFGGAGSDPSQFREPRGVTTDARGNLYVADTKNHRIQIFDGNGAYVRSIGAEGTVPGQFREPGGVAVDPEGQIYVADTWNHRVQRFGPDGSFRGVWADPEKGFFGPRAVVFSRDTLYVTDTGNKRIVRFDREGKVLGSWGSAGNGEGQFVEPVGLAADGVGNLYVADTGNHRVQVFDPEGRFLRQFPVYGWKDFYTEPYLAVGPGDTVFVTDSASSRAALYDSTGALKRSWQADEFFKAPTGIAIDRFGRLTVSDRSSHRVYVWSLAKVAP
jgi:uncharacterized protein (TIGR03663 family)